MTLHLTQTNHTVLQHILFPPLFNKSKKNATKSRTKPKWSDDQYEFHPLYPETTNLLESIAAYIDEELSERVFDCEADRFKHMKYLIFLHTVQGRVPPFSITPVWTHELALQEFLGLPFEYRRFPVGYEITNEEEWQQAFTEKKEWCKKSWPNDYEKWFGGE